MKHWEAKIVQSPNWYSNELGSGTGLYFEAYIADYGIHTGISVKDVLDKFKNPPSKKSQIKEIEI